MAMMMILSILIIISFYGVRFLTRGTRPWEGGPDEGNRLRRCADWIRSGRTDIRSPRRQIRLQDRRVRALSDALRPAPRRPHRPRNHAYPSVDRMRDHGRTRRPPIK